MPKTTYDREILTPDEAKALIRAAMKGRGAAAVRDTALVVLLYRSGLRIAEALTLRPRDVDLATGDVTVHHGKGGRRRVVRVDYGALALIERWIQRRTDLEIGAGPLFSTISTGRVLRPGRALSPWQFRETLRRLASRARITKRVHPHGLRATYASELDREGKPLSVIQAMLGHRSIATTAVYLRQLGPTEYLERAADRSWSLDA